MPARALKADDGRNDGILIELPTGTIVPEADDQSQKTNQPEKVEAEPDGVQAIRAELAAMKEAKRLSDEQAETARREAAAARRDAEDRARELADANRRTADVESDAIGSGLAAAQAEEKAARAALKAAIDNGDSEAQADAAARIGRAGSDIREFERAQATLAAQREREKTAQPERATTQAVDPIAAIDANPNLMPAEKTWLKAHSDAVVDPRRNARLGVAYDDAIAKGLIRGTEPYFKHLEQFMSYAQADTADTTERETDVQAPPSRNDRSPTGRVVNNKVKLTSDEMEVIENMGITPAEYAANLKRLEDARRADPDRYR